MDSKKFILNFFASSILFARNFTRLIIFPYETMRRISKENDWVQILIINIFVYFYFIFRMIIRRKTLDFSTIFGLSFVLFISFLFTFILIS